MWYKKWKVRLQNYDFLKTPNKKTLVENIPNMNSYIEQFNYGFTPYIFSTLQM